MTIETKFNVGETVYYMCNNKVHQSTVKVIKIYVRSPTVDVQTYLIETGLGKDGLSEYNEVWLFPTKESLLASL